jgi:predicted kinase
MRAAVDERAPTLAARAAAGRVRRCHGDLHLKNLCLWRGRVTPFDALEFDEALATIDTGYDLSFLLMDLWHRLGRAAANRVLNRYVARTGDAGLAGALPPWLSLRAAIRAHAEGGGVAGLEYLALAEAALRPAAPRLVAVGGLPGTGKTRLARALAPDLGAAPGALVLRSDEIRKRRHGVPPEQRLPASAYAPAENAAVFAELAALAGEAVRGGHAVIADAAFLRPEERAAIEAAASGAPFRGLWLRRRSTCCGRGWRRASATPRTPPWPCWRRRRRGDPGPCSWRALDAAADPLPAARRALAAAPDRSVIMCRLQSLRRRERRRPGRCAMAYRRLLLPLTGTAAGEAALATALMTARLWNAHVHCLHVRVDARDVAPLAGEGLSGAMIEEMMAATERESGERAGRVRELFQRVTGAAGGVTSPTARKPRSRPTARPCPSSPSPAARRTWWRSSRASTTWRWCRTRRRGRTCPPPTRCTPCCSTAAARC